MRSVVWRGVAARRARRQLTNGLLCAALALASVPGCGDDGSTSTNNTTTNNTATNNTTGQTNSANNALVIEDQQAEPRDQIVVKQVVAEAAGWLVIREAAGETFGAAIGLVAVDAGTTDDLTVTLDRRVRDGETLYATLHVEAPVDGMFTFSGTDGGDPPVRGMDGKLLYTSFVVGAEVITPALTVSDQRARPANTITVASAVSDGPGWVVVRADSDGAPGEVLGQVAVPKRESTDVAVTLSREVVHGETLHVALHVDDPVDGAFSFDPAAGDAAEDGPVLQSDGLPLASTITATLPPVPVVEVSDQTADPTDRVVVQRVVSDGQGWVVIHADDSGLPGEVLGQSLVNDGENANVTVALSRAVTDGETLHAMLHTDAGQSGVYEFPGDDVPVTDTNGAVVVSSFTATVPFVSQNAVEVEDQTPADPSAVLVKSVTSDTTGWIVIHADDGNGAPGDVLGHASVPAGMSSDITVTLSREVVDGETLFAMLHIDAGQPGVYEFPGADAPASDASGMSIAPPFIVSRAP